MGTVPSALWYGLAHLCPTNLVTTNNSEGQELGEV